MKEIYFEYNPFTLEFKLEEEGVKFNPESKIYSYNRDNKRLQAWIHKFIPELYAVINEDFILNFKGTSFDYDDISLEIDEFNKKHQTNIQSSLQEVKSIDTRLKELVTLFNSIKEQSPIDELKDENIFSRFYSDINKEFEIAVVATVSSGKSTLINSLLGKELMPSKKQACTAKIIRIKDVDNTDNVKVSCRDENENIIDGEEYRSDNADIDIIRKFNEDEKVHYIDLEMDIPFVNTDTLELVLLDTPGPNNFSDKSHEEKTRKVINESDPLILYVIDGDPSTDNKLLLENISKAMKRGGRQGKDRFIFVVNKVDELEIENGDSIDKAYHKIIAYLKDFDIVNPNIYFVSAKMAMIIKLIKNNEKLKKTNEIFFNERKCLFEDYEDFNLSKYSSLSKTSSLKIENMLNNAKGNLDKILIYSGLPSLEFAIKDYLEKYAMAEKMQKAVKSFITYIDDNNFIDKINEIKKKKEDENTYISQTIIKMKDQIKSCEASIPYFSDKINKLDMHDKIKTDFENIFNSFSERLHKEMDIIFEDTIKKSVGYNVQKGINEVKDAVHSLYNKVVNAPKIASNQNNSNNNMLLEDKYYENYNISILGKDEYVLNLNKIVKELLIQLSVELDSYLNKNISFVLENIINEYKMSIYNMLNEIHIFKFISKDLSIKSDTLFDRCSIDDINNALNNYVLNMKLELKPEFKNKWWDIQSWDIRLWNEFNIKEYNDYVYNKLVDDIKKEIDNITKNAIENIDNLKNYILSEVEKLEYFLKVKRDELKDINVTKEDLDQFIERENNKLLWIEDIKARLKDIITL